jgi:hypothetical protein
MNLPWDMGVAKDRQTVSLRAMAHRDWGNWRASLELGSYDAGRAMESERAAGYP